MAKRTQFGFSRFHTYRTCPKKYYYNYVENISGKEGEQLIMGRLFHKALELVYTDQDPKPALDEYKSLVSVGKLNNDPSLLEYVLNKYLEYYADSDASQEILAAELTLEEELSDGDFIQMTADRVYHDHDSGLVTLLDTKTTSKKTLSYTTDHVQYNNQLLFYVPFLEDHLCTEINAICIDEVRFAKLEDVPITGKGKPTRDMKNLNNVTYEAYIECLTTYGLETAPEYQTAILKLEKRGHPLFNRVICQKPELSVISSNIDDMRMVYESIKNEKFYRSCSKLCSWCEYQELCNFDRFDPDVESREIMISSLKISDIEEE